MVNLRGLIKRLTAHGLIRRPAHRDETAMNGVQPLKAHGDSSGLMSGPPAVHFSRRLTLPMVQL
jgi:hypothetical protein